MSMQDLSHLVEEMDRLNMKVLINLSGSGVQHFRQPLMDLNLQKSIEMENNFPNRFGVFVNLVYDNIDDSDFPKI